MTSPICPVSCSPPLSDGYEMLSMSSVSPPMLVHARPIAVPGTDARFISLSSNTGLPRYFPTFFASIVNFLSFGKKSAAVFFFAILLRSTSLSISFCVRFLFFFTITSISSCVSFQREFTRPSISSCVSSRFAVRADENIDFFLRKNTFTLRFFCRNFGFLFLFRLCSGFRRFLLRLGHEFGDDFTVYLVYAFFIIAHTSFTRIFFRYQKKSVFRIRYLIFAETVLFKIFRNKILLRYFQFFLIDIAGQLNDLSAVKQRFGNRIERIGGKNKEYAGNIKRQIKVVVAERHVLFRIEHFEKRTGRIALITLSHLVDFIDHENRRTCLCYLESLNDFSGECADVCAAVSLYFGFIAESAHRKAEERFVHCIRD